LPIHAILVQHLPNDIAMALSTSETIFWVKDSSQPFANDGVDFDFKAKAVSQIDRAVVGEEDLDY